MRTADLPLSAFLAGCGGARVVFCSLLKSKTLAAPQCEPHPPPAQRKFSFRAERWDWITRRLVRNQSTVRRHDQLAGKPPVCPGSKRSSDEEIGATSAPARKRSHLSAPTQRAPSAGAGGARGRERQGNGAMQLLVRQCTGAIRGRYLLGGMRRSREDRICPEGRERPSRVRSRRPCALAPGACEVG
ncbi:hypothetical protein DFJ74DRAFT_674957 [Hyaloraphidium curvatum]|nr:hypothetical protein DFJ74DRAFT_674957 [Hyaloraphidium curvatum]